MLKKYILYVVFTLPFTFSSPLFSEEYFGEYNGTVKTEWNAAGRTMTLLDDFSFEDANGLLWEAKKDHVIDGASIPKFLWSIVGSPFSDEYRFASVVHDAACDDKTRTWEVVHLAFYLSLIHI